MILTCPECRTQYRVPDHAVNEGGREVRCKQCTHVWHAMPDGSVGAPLAEPSLTAASAFDEVLRREVELPSEPAPVVVETLPPLKVPIMWFAAFAAMFLLATALSLLLFKPSWLGFAPTEPIVLADVELERLPIEKYERFAIKGQFLNRAATTRVAPTLRISLIDDKGEALQFWEFSDKTATIEAGKAMPFVADTLDKRFSRGGRYMVEIGNPLELALRRAP